MVRRLFRGVAVSVFYFYSSIVCSYPQCTHGRTGALHRVSPRCRLWQDLDVTTQRRHVSFRPYISVSAYSLFVNMVPSAAPSSQPLPTQRLSGGAVLGGRGIGIVDLEQEETRDAQYGARAHEGGGALGLSTSHEAATTADGLSMALSDVDVLTESRVRPRSRAGSVKKTPSSAMVKRGSMSTPVTVSATGAFVDHVIELPVDDDDVDNKRRTPKNGKQRTGTTSVGSRPTPRSVSRQSSVGLFSTAREVEVVVRHSGGSSKNGNERDKGKGKWKNEMEKRQTRTTDEAEVDEDRSSKPKPRLPQRRPDIQIAVTDDETKKQAHTETSEPRRRRIGKRRIIGSDSDSEDQGSEESLPPWRPTDTGSTTPVKSGMKPRPKSKSQSRATSGESEEEEVRVLAAESRTATGNEKRREDSAKATHNNKILAKENEKEKRSKERRVEAERVISRPRSPTRSPSPTSPITRNSCTPKRRLSVVVPSVSKQYFSSQSFRKAEGDSDHERGTGKKGADAGGTSGTKHKQLAPAASMQAVAAEASTSTTKRGRPSPATISAPITVSGKSKLRPQTKARPKPDASRKTTKTHADDDEDMGEEGEDNDTSMIVDSPVASTSRGGPRRSAANKATTRLREEIMPDVVNFEKEQKQAKRRRSVGGESVTSVREVEEREERGGKKRKVAKEVVEEVEEEAEVEVVVLAPSVKEKPIHGRGKAKKMTAVGSDEDTNSPLTKSKPSELQERKGDRGRGKEAARVRLMTTGVSLLDDVIKVGLLPDA